MKILAATNNKHKIEEISKIFSNTQYELVSPASMGLAVEVEEDGVTFAENAMKKAVAFSEASGMICIADDSGLTVDCLNGEPGIYSARYGSPDLDDKGRTNLLLSKMADKTDRRASFVCSLAMVFPNGRVIKAEGRCYGKIAYEMSGGNGFGYDPVFVPDGYDKTFAELSSEEKNSISHRRRALDELNKKICEVT